MKQVKKKRNSSNIVLLCVLLGLLIVLVVGYYLTRGLDSAVTEESTVKDPPEILEGEDIYLNSAIAYPRVSEASIQYIKIQNKNGKFDLLRPTEDGSFFLSYDSGDGVTFEDYVPPIVFAEGGFDYQTLYAKETGDGYGSIYLLTYLSVALGTPYFNERIPLPENKTERDALLAEYGFNKDVSEIVTFVYTTGEKDDEGNAILGSHSIKIGGRALSGTGYYFMVDERDYVYYTNSSYYEYALRGYHTFINGMLVSAGIASDSAYEPYLTTDFKEWANEKHKDEGEAVLPGSTVVVTGDSIVPLKKPVDYVVPPGEPDDGYSYETGKELSFDLEALKGHWEYNRISSILTGLSVGSVDRTLTMSYPDVDRFMIGESASDREKKVQSDTFIDFSETKTYKYKYTILAIESVLTDTDEITAEGSLVGDANLIKVKYFYYIDGKAATELPRHAVLDLSSPLIPDEARDALRASKVGAIGSVSFEIDYTENNSYSIDSSFVITKIDKIYKANGEIANKVLEDSIVVFTGYRMTNGVKGETETCYIDLAKADEYNYDYGREIKVLLVGLNRGSCDFTVGQKTKHYEVMREFTAYNIDEVKYFVTSELITSFRYVNASKRDPYFGESFYENTFDKNNPYHYYGLNASACEKVVAYLGGIGGSGSVTSAGFSGETVAVGINHATLDKYDLYEYKIYFELPRAISDITEGTEFDSDDRLSDFDWYSTLGFTLYISDKKYDPDTGAPFRYVASDKYDLVAKVYGEELDFVEFSFTEFWARRNFLLTSIERILNMEVDFNFEDYRGTYNFQVDHRVIYIGQVNGSYTSSLDPFDGAMPEDQISVYVSAEGDTRPATEYDKALAEYRKVFPNAKSISLSYLYTFVQNKEKFDKGETLWEDIRNTVGVASFRSVFELTQLVRYHGVLTEEEKAIANTLDPVMTIKIKMDVTRNDPEAQYEEGYYTYEFIRFDDRKVMVRLYETYADGTEKHTPVSEFYITTFALKKLVGNYINLLNGVSIDRDVGFFDQ